MLQNVTAQHTTQCDIELTYASQCEKRNFFVSRSVTENFQPKFFWGKCPRNPYALGIQNIYMKGRYKSFLTVFWLPDVG